MVNRNYRRQRSRPMTARRRGFRIPKLFLLLVLAALLWLFLASGPVIQKAAETQGKIHVNRIITQEVNHVLSDASLAYTDIVTLGKNSEGGITSAALNTKAVNGIKFSLADRITEALDQLRSGSYKVALGTLFGNELLVGRGPDVTLKIVPMGYADIQLDSQFEAAGINQTRHRILLRITVNYTTIIPLSRADTSLSTDFVLAETLIIGKVPEYYTDITSGGNTASEFSNLYPNQFYSSGSSEDILADRLD